ncbi:MAG: antibiotic biosynthesis monooxygenase [Dehalococcoidia bacterium]|nr:antibiotic biosynthesis monooxygenase [Dehalococcoidia bacterium]
MSELIGIVRFKFHPGMVDEYKRLVAHAMDVVRTRDTGTLQYDVFFNADETESIGIERFRDSESLIQHSQNLGDEFMAAVLATGEVTGELLGDPTPELAAMLGAGPPFLFRPYLRM